MSLLAANMMCSETLKTQLLCRKKKDSNIFGVENMDKSFKDEEKKCKVSKACFEKVICPE